jgi:sigma-54-specific transcriptional regulator
VAGSITDLSGLTIDPHWQQFSALFINCWQMISDLWQETRQKSALTASVNSIRDKEHRRELAQALQSTLIGQSDIMHSLRKEVVIAAQSNLNVLVHGETGTGKDLVANAVHDCSTRRNKPFVAINCAAIPESLLESELFGHAKGAFSGADRAKNGLFAEADGGTLFLDEIGDLPLTLQAKLLRVLESRCFRPVGGKEEIQVDFRLVAATHVSLNRKIQENAFRQDLYYRLEQFPIHVPALRQRLDDLPQLVDYFITAYNRSRNTRITSASACVMEWLNEHPFPGNVRELRNLIEYACALTDDDQAIAKQNLLNRELEEMPNPTEQSPLEEGIGSINVRTINDLKQAVQSFEYEVISSRLEKFGGNRSMAAKSLGIPKRTLAHKCLKMEIH